MNFDKKNIPEDILLQLYVGILTPRIIEEKMINLIRQGKISKWFSGVGQEAISVGSTRAIYGDEYILTMHRNLGVFTSRDVPLKKLFSQFQGKLNGFTKGRDRSFHFGAKEHHIVGMISHIGAQLGVADGIALFHKINSEKKATLVFTGEGGTSEGDFHEALNLAAVWSLPVIFVVENNEYALSTTKNEQYKCKQIIDKGIGYGIEAAKIDGNNILEVYSTVKKYADELRENPHPVLIEAVTFRMGGHEEASGTKYIPKHLIEHWSENDPLKNYESFLKEERIINFELIHAFREKIKAAVDNEWEIAVNENEISPSIEDELHDIYFPFYQRVIKPEAGSKSKKRFVDAVKDGLKQSMEKYPELIIMGQDIGEYGGVFKVTEGFIEKFGRERIRNTPLCESAVIAAGLGYSIGGGKAIVEMQFADFITDGFNQVVNNIAKIHYRWGQNADVVIRMPTGAGVNAGPFHSQSNEAWFFHTPGLKIIYPSVPYDAKGLINAAIEDPNPVLYFEHKALYRLISEEIPDDYYTVEIGKAAKVLDGNDVSIITYGMGIHWAKDILSKLNSVSADLIDLRTLLPWDKETVYESVKKCGKVIILHEDTLTGGIGGEISAWLAENCFEYLDAPVIRCGSLDTPVPFSSNLEKNFLPEERFTDKLVKLLKY